MISGVIAVAICAEVGHLDLHRGACRRCGRLAFPFAAALAALGRASERAAHVTNADEAVARSLETLREAS